MTDDLKQADSYISDASRWPSQLKTETKVALATAIYLRAIYQKLSGDFLTQPINQYGEGIGDAIQGQLVRGMAGISQYDK